MTFAVSGEDLWPGQTRVGGGRACHRGHMATRGIRIKKKLIGIKKKIKKFL